MPTGTIQMEGDTMLHTELEDVIVAHRSPGRAAQAHQANYH